MDSHGESPTMANSGHNCTRGHQMAVLTTLTAINAQYTFRRRNIEYFGELYFTSYTPSEYQVPLPLALGQS